VRMYHLNKLLNMSISDY